MYQYVYARHNAGLIKCRSISQHALNPLNSVGGYYIKAFKPTGKIGKIRSGKFDPHTDGRNYTFAFSDIITLG